MPVVRKNRVVIYGAGEAGRMVLNEIRKNPELGLQVIAFIDDDSRKWKRKIRGVEVVGGQAILRDIYIKKGFDRLIISIPSASANDIQKIIKECSRFSDVDIKIVPGTRQIINGDVHWNHIREVAVEDLLGREEISIDNREMSKFIGSKTVLITGAGGSIGSELVRQVITCNPSKIILLGRGENSIYQIFMEILNRKSKTEVIPVIADVRDLDAITSVFSRFKIDVIFHAAAHKHVPLMESFPKEAFKNNVMGSLNLLDLASKNNVSQFVLISTDKAVNPTSVMGASKRITEILLQIFSQKYRNIRFSAVRFGNVLGSRGSVIPLFKQQIQQGGPVTITHKKMVRFFMTIPEAVSLLLQSGVNAKGGEIFVLDMGKPVPIYELAVNLIRLSGFKPHEDIKIKVTGLRPGEKLFEEIMTDSEGIKATKNSKIFVAKPEKHDASIIDKIKRIESKIANMTDQAVKKEIFKLTGY